MGGGAGLSVNGRYRVATERAVFAMPEARIGFAPDCGASRFLGRCPGHLGLYLGLTGRRCGAADMLHLGLATHFTPSARLPALREALAAAARSCGPGPEAADAAVRAVLDAFHEAPAGPRSWFEDRGYDVDRCFSAGSVEAVLGRLARYAAPLPVTGHAFRPPELISDDDREHGSWAQRAAAAIGAGCPMSAKVFFAAFHRARGRRLAMAAAMESEFRVSMHFLRAGYFAEGVRALHGDGRPRWAVASLRAATAERVEGFFAPLPPMRVVDAHGRSRVVAGLELEGVYPNELLAAL